ncbi:hypothetical protein ACQP00_20660 [Dactylosporangium sp. CS-047395]|uniref:hypothetical protein n=1 Tax=Dactylosporangium sp. CS-047395 TaxID=3239936 RepID=UPI003D907520
MKSSSTGLLSGRTAAPRAVAVEPELAQGLAGREPVGAFVALAVQDGVVRGVVVALAGGQGARHAEVALGHRGPRVLGGQGGGRDAGADRPLAAGPRPGLVPHPLVAALGLARVLDHHREPQHLVAVEHVQAGPAAAGAGSEGLQGRGRDRLVGDGPPVGAPDPQQLQPVHVVRVGRDLPAARTTARGSPAGRSTSAVLPSAASATSAWCRAAPQLSTISRPSGSCSRSCRSSTV